MVARKQVRCLEAGHDDLVANVHNQLIREGKILECTKLAGEPLLTSWLSNNRSRLRRFV